MGCGDIAPQTPVGQALAAMIMIVGYGIIAVPTGIVTVELANVGRRGGEAEERPRVCAFCHAADHDANAIHCKYCGTPLEG